VSKLEAFNGLGIRIKVSQPTLKLRLMDQPILMLRLAGIWMKDRTDSICLPKKLIEN
jgi:hypothetical protein